jgi:hypothetical protein
VQKIGKNGAKWPQKYQIAIEYTKIAIKYTKIFHPEAFHNIQKWTFLVLKIPSGNPDLVTHNACKMLAIL